MAKLHFSLQTACRVRHLTGRKLEHAKSLSAARFSNYHGKTQDEEEEEGHNQKACSSMSVCLSCRRSFRRRRHMLDVDIEII